jgi:uridine kinase
MERAALLELLAGHITRLARPHPVRVAIDGVDGVGKTTLADELVAPIAARGRPVIRASIDGFHHPRSVRYRLGRQSPEGYFRDSFNEEVLVATLLQPLGPNGSRQYRRAVFDYRRDAGVDFPIELAPVDAVLLFDGVFLHRPELCEHWDFSVFLDAPFEVTIPRYARRDGVSPDLNAPDNRRYIEGQELYLRECQPARRAAIVIDQTDIAAPRVRPNAREGAEGCDVRPAPRL